MRCRSKECISKQGYALSDQLAQFLRGMTKIIEMGKPLLQRKPLRWRMKGKRCTKIVPAVENRNRHRDHPLDELLLIGGITLCLDLIDFGAKRVRVSDRPGGDRLPGTSQQIALQRIGGKKRQCHLASSGNSSFFKFYSSEETTVKNDEIWRTRPPAGWTTA